jgi:hypothetical protein
MALKNDGTVWTWGDAYYGQLGIGESGVCKLPAQVSGSFAETQPPTPPCNLRLISYTADSAILSWEPSTDNVGVTGYEVYNGTAMAGSTTGDAEITITGLSLQTPYSFTVKARDAAGNLSSASNYADFTLVIRDIARAVNGTVAASGEIAGGNKENAFDNNASTKWAVSGNTGWIQYQFSGGQQYAITKYTLTSASDNPQYDPVNITLKGSNDGINWTTLYIRTNEAFTGRMQKKEYDFNNTIAYGYYRLEMSNASTSLQIGKIGLIEKCLT